MTPDRTPAAFAPLRCLLAAVLLVLAPVLGAADVDRPAPALSLPGREGPVSLVPLQGKVVFVDFWASWCGPCKQSFPWLNEMQARYGARGLQVLAVNLDQRRSDADSFLAQVPSRFLVAFDPQGDSARRYGVKGMPSSVLVGADGRVVQQHTGFRDDDKAALEAAIVAALQRAGR